MNFGSKIKPALVRQSSYFTSRFLSLLSCCISLDNSCCLVSCFEEMLILSALLLQDASKEKF